MIKHKREYDPAHGRRVMYVPDMARYFGLSEGAIRNHISRQNWDTIPQPIKLGVRTCWLLDDVDAFLEGKSNSRRCKKKKPATTFFKESEKRR